MSAGAGAKRIEDTGRATWADVDATFRAGLDRTSSERGRASLRHVRDSIDALRAAGSVVTFQAVGAWCLRNRGGPTGQSVQNNQRAADLVRVAAAVQAADARPSTGRPVEMRLLEQIGDPGQRAELEGLLARGRAALVEVNGLRAAVRRIKAISFLTEEMAKCGLERLEEVVVWVEEVKGSTGGVAFSDEERAACRDFLLRGLALLGFEVDEPSGEIIDHSKRTVAPRGIVSALRSVADLGSQDRAIASVGQSTSAQRR